MSADACALPFAVERQEGHLQCWAPVALALRRWYGLAPVPAQGEFARAVLGEHCDHECAPLRAFAHAGLDYDELPGPMPLPMLRAHIAAGHPVPACLRYFIGWHLVVVHGIDANGFLIVADPLHGASRWSYAQFAAAYRDHYGWSHAYRWRGIRTPAANTL
nr:papain-like cysteine protease family protein [uncultured Massilia sp.]